MSAIRYYEGIVVAIKKYRGKENVFVISELKDLPGILKKNESKHLPQLFWWCQQPYQQERAPVRGSSWLTILEKKIITHNYVHSQDIFKSVLNKLEKLITNPESKLEKYS